LRLSLGLRFWNYAAFAVLFVTGAIWLVADQLKTSENGEMWQTIAANALMFHGMTAMIALILLGAMIPLHIQRSWRAGKNRITGFVMVATNAALVVTASGLYYAGSDELRTLVADVHIAVGLALPALIVTHIALGRRARTPARHVPAPLMFRPRSTLSLFQKVADLGKQLRLARRLRRLGGLGGFRLLQLRQPPDRQEQHEGDDQEIEDDREKIAPSQHGALFLCISQRGGSDLGRQRNEIVREVKPAGDRADNRHNDIADERTHDRAERRPDDHADGQIDNIAAQGKLFEIFEH